MNNTQFDILDILTIIAIMIQIDDHNNNRIEYDNIKNEIKNINNKLDILLERR